MLPGLKLHPTEITSYWEEKNPTKLSTEINLTKRQCIFPSVHKRKAIYECQHIDISPPNEQISMTNQYSLESKWWCPLTDNFDHYPEWQNCPVTTSTYAGNQPGKQCHFPFIYRKRLYSTCIRTNGELYFDNINDPMPIDNGKSGYWWCSTTKDFDFDGLWTKCRPQLAYQLPFYGLNLPLWLNDWSESAWNNYALNMREQWNQLTVYLYYQWLKTWLIAFIFELTSSNSMNQINIEQSRNMHNSLMYTHTTNNHFNTLYSIHDIDTTQINRNNQHYTLEKLINNSIDSCCCHYLLTKDNTTNNTTTLMNTTDICINSSINH
ncbi:Epididymal sperm-binding protein, partial [Schistosoma japonicum]